LYSLGADNSLTETGEIVGHRGGVTAVAFSPDGTKMAAGDSNREVCLWDVGSRTALVQGTWVYHSTTITSVVWAPSGKYIASGSLDGHIYIWTVPADGEKVGIIIIVGMSNGVGCIELSEPWLIIFLDCFSAGHYGQAGL
jgi:WD40 repeat protein